MVFAPKGPSAGQDSSAGAEKGAAALLLAYLQEQLAELLRQQERVRAEEPEAVHKMRVSTRRLRSALASYRRLLEKEPARSLRGDLKWLAQVLGGARDAQVMRHRLQALVASQPPDLVLGPVAARIDEELLSDYSSAVQSVHQALDSERYGQMVKQLAGMVADPPWNQAETGSGRHAAEAMIRRDRGRLRARVKEAKAEKDPEKRAEILHEARKEAKRLRYAAEAWRPAGGSAADAMVEAAEGLQKTLGEHQDSVVTRSLLRWMGSTAGEGENGFTYGRLHAIEEHRGRAAEKNYRRLWNKFPPGP